MDDLEVIEEIEEETVDRVRASVQHALRLVGPAEGGAERYWPETPPASSRPTIQANRSRTHGS
jgi:hypothetical protein